MVLKSTILFFGLLFLLVINISQTYTNQSYAICTNGDHTTTDGKLPTTYSICIIKYCDCPPASIGSDSNVKENFTVTNSSQLATYEDPLLGFKFKYPAEWQPLLDKNIEDTGVAFNLFKAFKHDDLRLGIYTDKLPENETLKQYLRDVVSKEFCCVDHQSLKTNEIKFGDVPVMNASWNLSEKGKVFGKTMIVFAIKDKIAYVISSDMYGPSPSPDMYSPSSEAIDKYLPSVKKIIKSFQITD